MSGDWADRAACRGMDPDLFFPQRAPDRGTVAEVAAAKRVCAGCPVREPCLHAGLWEKVGVWGGTTDQERRPLRRTQTMECERCGTVVERRSVNRRYCPDCAQRARAEAMRRLRARAREAVG